MFGDVVSLPIHGLLRRPKISNRDGRRAGEWSERDITKENRHAFTHTQRPERYRSRQKEANYLDCSLGSLAIREKLALTLGRVLVVLRGRHGVDKSKYGKPSFRPPVQVFTRPRTTCCNPYSGRKNVCV